MKRLLVWVLAFITVFVPFRSVFSDLIHPYMKVIPDLLLLGVLILHLITNRFRFNFIAADWGLFGFIVLACISTILINDRPIGTFVFQLRSMFVYYILFFVVRNYTFTQADKRFILRLLKIAVYILFVFAAVEVITNKDYLFPSHIEIVSTNNFPRAYSLMQNPNVYGTFMVLAVFLSLDYEDAFGQTYDWPFYTVAFAATLMSVSRSSILILAILMLYDVFIRRHAKQPRRIRRALAVLVMVVFALIVYSVIQLANDRYSAVNPSSGQVTVEETNPVTGEVIEEVLPEDSPDLTESSLIQRFRSILTGEDVQFSRTDGRLWIVATGLRIFRDFPVFGKGFGSFGSSSSKHLDTELDAQYNLRPEFYADNQYISTLVETGILGFAALWIFVFMLFRYCWNRRINCFIFVIFLWYSLFYNTFEVQIVSFLFSLYIGMYANRYEKDSTAQP